MVFSKTKRIAYTVFMLFICHINSVMTFAEPGRATLDLSGSGWHLWRDVSADWIGDDLYLPPVEIESIPVNPPTCGWDKLDKVYEKKVSVPGTVEEHFWSDNGNPNGIAGDYRGVSWWSRTFAIPAEFQGKRLIIRFESVNLRAEVYINNKLAGYDVIGNTPFEADISSAVMYGGENRLDVRITDPVGSFSWNDEYLMRWGKNYVPAVHGFGGITGPVTIIACDSVRIEDIYVQNTPEITSAELYVTLTNDQRQSIKGDLSIVVHEWGNPGSIIWKNQIDADIKPGVQDIHISINAPNAKPWQVGDPHLYVADIQFRSDDDSIMDKADQRFGFRFFTVDEKDGDKRFYVNNRRVFILAAMTRGFWPKNGIFPTPDMARRDMEAARQLGFNMMLYHRAIGQPVSMAVADEMGVLSYEEPGGYLCNPGGQTDAGVRMAPVPEFAREWRREKLRRMVLRDRSCPSLAIYNIDDLSWNPPGEDDIANIRMVHTLDPSRPITYNCIIKPVIPNEKENPFKLHMLPFDESLHYHGWIAPYHFAAHAGYIDEYYNNPRNYLRYLLEPIRGLGDSLQIMPEDEIIFYGEEGGFGTMLRLDKIREELLRTGSDGWREKEHLAWYDSYDRYLDESGMRNSYPTVDHFTTSLGSTMHYFHGRIIENTRISNKVDAYVINGWASAATHTDIVDTYRYSTADPDILKHYTQPLYIAVKIRVKVMPIGTESRADIYIVNEADIRGKHSLLLSLSDPDGQQVFESKLTVNILGGEEYGQLLVEDIVFPKAEHPGRYVLKAELHDQGGVVCADGSDEIYVVDCMPRKHITGNIAVIDTSNVVADFLAERGVDTVPFDPEGPEYDCIIIGEHDFNKTQYLGKPNVRGPDPVMTRVANGTTLIILDHADLWAQERSGVHNYPALSYLGSARLGDTGRFFTGRDMLLDGLPSGQAMNWEYQVFYRGEVWGLRLARRGVHTIVGLAPQNSDDILDALCRVPFGNGSILLSTLDILPNLHSEQPYTAPAKRLLLNMVEQAAGIQ